jgi:hypothetical protein
MCIYTIRYIEEYIIDSLTSLSLSFFFFSSLCVYINIHNNNNKVLLSRHRERKHNVAIHEDEVKAGAAQYERLAAKIAKASPEVIVLNNAYVNMMMIVYISFFF